MYLVGGVKIDVIRPENLNGLEYDIIILALDWADEAIEQLTSLGVDPFKINTTYIINKGIGARDIFLQNFSQDIYHKNIKGAVAEAGVFKGAFSAKINIAFPDRKLYLFDTFEGFDERDIRKEKGKAINPLENSGYFNQTSEQVVMDKMKFPENVVIRKGYIPDTLEGVNDTFCFINLDLDLYEPTRQALDFFYDKVEIGGGILVHDFYNDYSFPNLKKSVIEFAKKRGIFYLPIGDGLSVFLPKIQ